MRKLILIKHSKPQVDPSQPSHLWRLSQEGRDRCPLLAEQLRPHDPSSITSSEEPKARETGRLIATSLDRPFQTAAGLHEHDRTNVPHMQTREFISWMALFFQKPHERVVGLESADEALQRFSAAVERVLKANPEGNPAIVTHGTVLALFAQAKAGQNGYHLWRQMQLPSFAVFSLDDWRLTELADRV